MNIIEPSEKEQAALMLLAQERRFVRALSGSSKVNIGPLLDFYRVASMDECPDTLGQGEYFRY